jgi:signal transduction histidine kinase/ActR/RegA family two-component response regulator
LAPAILLLVGLVVTGSVTAFVARTAGDRDRARFDDSVTATQDAIQERMKTYLDALQASAGLFAAAAPVSRPEFHAFVGHLELSSRFPGNRGIGWSPTVFASQQADFVLGVRQSGRPDFRLFPSSGHPVRQPVLLIEPLDHGNKDSLGYDMASEPRRREAMQRARDTGKAAATAEVPLEEQGSDSTEPGFIVFTPVYGSAGVPATVEQRRRKLKGFVYSPFRVRDLLRGIFAEHSAAQLAFNVYDGTRATPGTLLFSAGQDVHQDNPYMRGSRRIQVAGRTWTLDFASTPRFDAASHRGNPPLVLLAGLMVTLLITAVTWFETRARAEAERSKAEAEKSREALRRANQAKDEFIAMLGHELRNPVGALVNIIRVMRLGKMDKAALNRYLDVAARQVRLQTRLVDDLLDVSRFSTGNVRLQQQPVDLAQIARRALGDMAARAEDHGQELALEVPAEPVVVDGDLVRLEQVIANLLSNAIKYTPTGGKIRLVVELDPSVGEPPGEAVVRVIDTGIGIAPAQLEGIFELFAQTDKAKTRAQGGLGIGLTLAKRLIELHGGHITAHSPGENQGSEFSVHLPAIEAEPVSLEHPSSLRATSAAGEEADGKRRLKILIVEDNADARDMLRELLVLLGHDVIVAEDGRVGIEKALHLHPDIALVDLGLPVVSGFEVAERVRAEREASSIRLIALTGYGQPEDRRRALEAGFDEHMVKPLDLDGLEKVLSSVESRA